MQRDGGGVVVVSAWHVGGTRGSCIVVVCLTTPPKNVEWSNNRFYTHRPMVSPHLTRIRTAGLTGGPIHSTSKCPTSTGAVHKSLPFSYVFMLVQLNKCVVVCGSDLQRGHIGDWRLSSPILFKYEHYKGHLFVLSCARV